MISSHFLTPAYRELTQLQFGQLQKLCDVFLRKNAQMNLSAIRDESGVWEKHVYDSLLGAEFVENSGRRVLDLGSGGGFPALPLAIVFPEKQFFPFDSVGKKMKAVGEMAGANGGVSLPNVFPLTGRAEELGRDPQYREQFDMVTARAFAAFSVCLELALPFVMKGGRVVLYRGPDTGRDDENLIRAFGAKLRTRKQCALPSGDQREIWEIEKVRRTDARFPRQNGIPKKNPIVLSDFKRVFNK